MMDQEEMQPSSNSESFLASEINDEGERTFGMERDSRHTSLDENQSSPRADGLDDSTNAAEDDEFERRESITVTPRMDPPLDNNNASRFAMSLRHISYEEALEKLIEMPRVTADLLVSPTVILSSVSSTEENCSQHEIRGDERMNSDSDRSYIRQPEVMLIDLREPQDQPEKSFPVGRFNGSETEILQGSQRSANMDTIRNSRNLEASPQSNHSLMSSIPSFEQGSPDKLRDLVYQQSLDEQALQQSMEEQAFVRRLQEQFQDRSSEMPARESPKGYPPASSYQLSPVHEHFSIGEQPRRGGGVSRTGSFAGSTMSRVGSSSSFHAMANGGSTSASFAGGMPRVRSHHSNIATMDQQSVFEAAPAIMVRELLSHHPSSDHIELLPAIESRQRVFVKQPLQQQNSFGYSSKAAATPKGRRRIRLVLKEEVQKSGRGLIGHFRQRSRSIVFGLHDEIEENETLPRGRITVSWFEGTTSLELLEHVRKSMARKLKVADHTQIQDLRFMDESSDPPEEIVLSPFIPDGSEFVLVFSLRDVNNDGSITSAPESPSAAPSPHPSNPLLGLNAKQLALLKLPSDRRLSVSRSVAKRGHGPPQKIETTSSSDNRDAKSKSAEHDDEDNTSKAMSESYEDELVLQPEDPIEARLRQITELLLNDRQKARDSNDLRRVNRQVIFVLANYFVLFLSLIAISAEIQARAPNWLHSLEKQMKNVENCAADKEALFQCVSNGDLAGLVASIGIWLTRSVATRRIFLFGFETPQKLWTVVYESLVTAICWGISYLFIRRAMNPDTRPKFLQKYWKDAVYGSLAGFNAAFMKHVLKNLIPQEAVEDVLRETQPKILTWLKFHM